MGSQLPKFWRRIQSWTSTWSQRIKSDATTCRLLWIAALCPPSHSSPRSCKTSWDPTMRLWGSEESAKRSEFQGWMPSAGPLQACCMPAASRRKNGSSAASFKNYVQNSDLEALDLMLGNNQDTAHGLWGWHQFERKFKLMDYHNPMNPFQSPVENDALNSWRSHRLGLAFQL